MSGHYSILVCIDIGTEEELVYTIEHDISSTGKWTRLNKLKKNFKKLNFVTFACSKRYYPWLDNLRCVNWIIITMHSTKYSSIFLDKTLNFSDHINCIKSKLPVMMEL